MNRKLYWIVQQHVLNVIFRIKKGLFRMSEGKDQTDRRPQKILCSRRNVTV